MITFRYKGKVVAFYRTGANNPDQSIPGRVGKKQGTLYICGDGFKFEENANA